MRTGYAPDDNIPVEAAPATLTEALEGSGLFDLASEISSEWPTTSGTAGLRGARRPVPHRVRAALPAPLRRRDAPLQRLLAAGFITLVGVLFLPGTTVESAGVLEATLFDVKTGTILFTVHERVRKKRLRLLPE